MNWTLFAIGAAGFAAIIAFILWAMLWQGRDIKPDGSSELGGPDVGTG